MHKDQENKRQNHRGENSGSWQMDAGMVTGCAGSRKGVNIYQESCWFWAESPGKSRKLELPVTQRARLRVNWKSKALTSLKPGQYVHSSRSPKGTSSLPAGKHVFTVLTKQKRQRGRTTWLRLSSDRKPIILNAHTALLSSAPSKAERISSPHLSPIANWNRQLEGSSLEKPTSPREYPLASHRGSDNMRPCPHGLLMQWSPEPSRSVHAGGTEGLITTAALRRKSDQTLIKEARASKNRSQRNERISRKHKKSQRTIITIFR